LIAKMAQRCTYPACPWGKRRPDLGYSHADHHQPEGPYQR
jgi:hypothetical protein